METIDKPPNLSSDPFATLKNELLQAFDKPTREVIVTLLNVAPVDKDKLRKSEFELVSFLEKSRYISEKDVSPFLKVVASAKNLSLASILLLLVDYRPRPSVRETSNGKDFTSLVNVFSEAIQYANAIPKLKELIRDLIVAKKLDDLFVNDKDTLRSVVALQELPQQISKVMELLQTNNELFERFDQLCNSFHDPSSDKNYAIQHARKNGHLEVENLLKKQSLKYKKKATAAVPWWYSVSYQQLECLKHQTRD
jgi:hypothetical protein